MSGRGCSRKSIREREGGWKTDGVEAVCRTREEVGEVPDKVDGCTTPSQVTNITSLCGSSAKEAVSAIREVVIPSSNDQCNKVHLLISNSSRVMKLNQ